MRYGGELIDLIEFGAFLSVPLNKINTLSLSTLSTLSTLSSIPFVPARAKLSQPHRIRPSGTVRQGLVTGWKAGRSGIEARRTDSGRKLDNPMTTAETTAHRYRQNAMLPIRKCKSLKTLSGGRGYSIFGAFPRWTNVEGASA
jgi:hypothetical protein